MVNTPTVSKEKVSYFMVELEGAKQGLHLTEIEMQNSPKAYSKLDSEKYPIMLGWEWERVIKHDMEMTKKGRAVLKKILTGPLQLYVNARHEVDDLELVSIPASLKSHKQWMTSFLFKPELGLEEVVGRGSVGRGIHVHISKQYFTKESLTRFIAFISNPNNAGFINDIAGRNIRRTNWCRPHNVTFTNKDGKIVDHNIRVDDSLTLQGQYGCKSAAVNTITVFDTVELRIFRTVSTKDAMFKILEFTDALVRFCGVHQLEEMYADDFMAYVKRKRKDYPNLILHKPKVIKRILKGRKNISGL